MKCIECGQGVDALTSFRGRCGQCHSEHLRASVERKTIEEFREAQPLTSTPPKNGEIKRFRNPSESQRIILTTETSADLKIQERTGIISTEVVVGMNLFKDLFTGVRNVVGGRSNTVQSALREIRIKALDELKREAFDVEADAVVGVSLNYQEIGATGSTMLMLVATGTAVKLTKE